MDSHNSSRALRWLGQKEGTCCTVKHGQPMLNRKIMNADISYESIPVTRAAQYSCMESTHQITFLDLVEIR